MRDNTKLTRKQKLRADKVLETNNLTEAAAQVYNVKNRNVAGRIGAENVMKPVIKQYLSDKGDLAGSKIVEIIGGTVLSGGKKKPVPPAQILDASKYVYDQVHGKALQRNINANLNLTKDLDKMSDEELEKFINSTQN